jgi:hypothetical protein
MEIPYVILAWTIPTAIGFAAGAWTMYRHTKHMDIW